MIEGITIRPLEVVETYELRRRVLRNNDPGARVHMAADDSEDTWHFGAVLGGAVVATASFYSVPCPRRPRDEGAVQLRFMAVDPAHQRSGIGHDVIVMAMERLRRDGHRLLWANARNSALDFYTRLGFETVGPAFVEPTTGLPHTVIIKSL